MNMMRWYGKRTDRHRGNMREQSTGSAHPVPSFSLGSLCDRLFRPGLLCLAMLAGLFGCRPPASGPLYLDRGVPFALREPGAGPAFFSTQEVRFFMADGSQETLVTTVENDASRLSIVASTPMGQTLFTVQVQGGQVAVDKRIPLPQVFDPRLLPALIQLANWPLDEVRKGLDAGATLEETGGVRTLRRKGRISLTLQREGAAPPYSKVTLELPAASLRAVITTLED